MPQHFVAPPQWEWYIVWYFFLGGLAGGAYLLGTILRLVGDQRDSAISRLAINGRTGQQSGSPGRIWSCGAWGCLWA